MAECKRNYFETVTFLGHQMFQSHMKGGMFPGYIGENVVCFIYGVTSSQLRKDVLKAFNTECNIHLQNTSECTVAKRQGETTGKDVVCPKCSGKRIDPAGRGGKRCYICGHTFGAD